MSQRVKATIGRPFVDRTGTANKIAPAARHERRLRHEPLEPRCLLSMTPTASELSAGAGVAYLADVMDQYHDRLWVYEDISSAGNHFHARGKIPGEAPVSTFGSHSAEKHTGATSIRNEFCATSPTAFGGFYFMNGVLPPGAMAPELNFGTIPDAGANLLGVKSITFWAKGEQGQEKIEFFVGGVGRDAGTGQPTEPYPDSSPRYPAPGSAMAVTTLTTEWQQFTYDVSNLDMSYVLGGFGWMANAPSNPNGAVFYLDDIYYEFNDAALQERLNQPRFLRSFTTLDVQPDPMDANKDDDTDLKLRSAANVYDNSLAVLAFLADGSADSVRRAKLVGDAIVYATEHDRTFDDGRLRSFYMAGDIHLPPGWIPNDRTNTAPIPGFYYESGNVPPGCDQEPDSDYVEFGQGSVVVGDNTWGMIALLALYQQTGDTDYLDTARRIGGFIREFHNDTGTYQGFQGGIDDPETSTPILIDWASTEHNLDVFAAFGTMYQITGEQEWLDDALHAREFVDKMWSPERGCYFTGTHDPETRNETPGQLPLDAQTWSILALRDLPADRVEEIFACIEDNHRTGHHGRDGYDFNEDNDGVWFEGTGQAAVAYAAAGKQAEAEYWRAELHGAQETSPFGDGQGIAAACHDGLGTGFPWEYFQRLHVGATAWLVFAQLGVNPFHLTSASPGVQLSESDGSTVVTEGGDTDTYQVTLASRPADDVTIQLVDETGQVTAVDDSNPGSSLLAFTAANWDVPQSVRVAAVDDSEIEGVHTANIIHTAASADPRYDGIGIDGVAVTINDNDIIIVNRAPVAEVDTYFTDIDPASWASVLDNDHDADGDSLSALLVTDASYGSVVLASDGSFQYTPVSGFFGLDNFTYAANDGELDSNVATVTINVVQSLGAVALTEVPGLNASQGPLWLRLETVREGTLTVRASVAAASGDVQLDLYDESRADPPLATSSLVGDAQRIDFAAEAAQEVYCLRVSGTSNEIDLRLANLVVQAGSEVTVHGTSDADTFDFDASGPASPMLTIDGLDYVFEQTQITQTTFVGGPGDDQVVFRGGSATETALLYPDRGTFKDGRGNDPSTWSVDVSEVESITAHAGIGGKDEAFLYDSSNDDTFESWPFHGRLAGDGFALEAFDFVLTYGYATTSDGGRDSAVFHDSARNDKLKLDWPDPNNPQKHFVKMYRGDYYNRAKMFEEVQVDFSDGNDLVRLFGSNGDDTLDAQRDASRMYGPGFDLTVTGYDTLLAHAGDGTDTVNFNDSPANDILRARAHKTMMWSGRYADPDYLLMARRFDEVHASAAGFGDDFDVAKLHDTVGDDHLTVEYNSGDTTISRAAVFRNLGGTQLRMLYQAMAYHQVNAYHTTGDDTKDIDSGVELLLQLRGGW